MFCVCVTVCSFIVLLVVLVLSKRSKGALFQIGCAVVLCAFATPDALWLRLLLIVASLLLMIWASGPSRQRAFADVFMWNVVFLCVNVRYAIVIFFKAKHSALLSPVKVDDQVLEAVYAANFKLVMARTLFKHLADVALIRTLDRGEYYARASDNVNYLSILIKGSVEIERPEAQKQRFFQSMRAVVDEYGMPELVDPTDTTNNEADEDDSSIPLAVRSMYFANKGSIYVCVNEFLDSREWLVHNSCGFGRFRVNMRALEDCVYVTWPCAVLDKVMGVAPEIGGPFVAALELDVARKLFRTE